MYLSFDLWVMQAFIADFRASEASVWHARGCDKVLAWQTLPVACPGLCSMRHVELELIGSLCVVQALVAESGRG